MSIARRPRRIGASVVALALMAGLLFVAPAGAAESPEASPIGSAEAPWWVDWLEVFDLNNNKIDDLAESKARAFITAGKPNKTVPILLTFARALPDETSLVDFLGAKTSYFFETQPVADLDVPARYIERLAAIPGLAAVEYDMKVHPVLDVSAPATQANRGSGTNTFYNGQTAEDLGYTGDGMVVAVLDTGVQDVHEGFPGKFIAGAYVAAPASVNCVNPPDGDGHGTHVASTALGQLTGSRTLNGTAKSAKLVDIKISIDAGATSATIGGIARGFDFVKRYNDALAAGSPLCGPNDDHIDVATLSFGSTGRGGPNAGTDEAFINALVNSGVAVTIAVGNCGPQASSTCSFSDTDNGISSPGNATGAIGVASFDDRGTVDRANDIISGFSSRGPNNSSGDNAAGGATGASNLQDRYRKPEIAAPGQSITAAGPAPFTLNTISGTSMATPHVAGISALLLEAGEDAKAQTGGRNLMMSTGNGYSATGAYLPGVYPVRDAIIHAPDYKAAGAEAKWTGPNSAGLQWNNAWGYGQVNTFGALCWAWQNVLLPGGATPPDAVANGCELSQGDPTVTISSPTDGSTVPEGIVNVAGIVDRDGGPRELIATLAGPDEVANGSAAGYSLTASNANGAVTCTINAEGSPERADEAADGCAVDLTWTTDGTHKVTGEVTDGTATASATLDVTVTTPSGIPEPDGSINGGITMFADANPFLAVNELAALTASAIDPAPKFLPGESVTFHTRFTEDANGAVATSGDTFKWHIWNSTGELVGTMPCVTSSDSDLTAPNGFDCEASAALPSDIGRYYTTLQYTKDGRWSCHGMGPLENLILPSGIPQCIKAFDIVTNTSTGAGVLPQRGLGDAMSYLVKAGAPAADAGWSIASNAGAGPSRPALSADAAAADPPSEVPEDPQITDATGDVTAAGLPIDHMDVEAAWFENDASFLYVGLKVADIPADSSTTAQIAYHVNFKPDWVTNPQAAFGVPATNTFTGLRVQGVLSPVGFNGLTNPTVKDTHHAELQHLSTTAPPANTSQFGKVADLELVSVDPDSDIIWWAVPRAALANPSPDDTLSALSANVVPAVRGLVTLGTAFGDTATSARTFGFVDTETPLSAVAGGPYSGAPNTPISILGAGAGGTAPYSCAWSGPAAASFADAGACGTTVTFSNTGNFNIELTVTDDAGNQATASVPVAVADAAGERVEIFLDETNFVGTTAVDTDATNPRAEWSVPIDLTELVGLHSVTARWFDADDTLLSEDSITINVEEVGPEFEVNITSPADGAEVESDFVVEGTTTGTESEAGAQGSRVSARWKRAVKVIPADRLKVTNHGPPVPADSVGIGPGSTLLTNFIDPADGLEYVGICTAAFIFRDPNTGKVYVGAAGHCFIAPSAVSTDGPGANWNRDLTLRIRICVSTCIGGASGLFSEALFGLYPGTTRDLGELAYARQTLGGVDVGNDFGIVEIPPALHDEIRTDLPVWEGPSMSEPLHLEGGEFLANYGNGIGLGEVFATKARMGIGAGIDGGSWLAAMATSQGDSGSAVVGATVTVGTQTSVDGLAPLGMLTHLVCCLIAGNPYTTAGTTVARAIEMASQDAGINLELIHDVAQLAVSTPLAPTGLSATAGDGTVGLSWTAPSDGGAPISGYTVKYGTQAGGPYPDTRTVTGTEATIDGLTNGVTYHFVVSATNSEGESPNSAEVSATPTSISTVPGAPTNLTGLAGDGQVALSWQAPADDGGTPITGYTVKFGPTAGGPYPNTIEVSDTAATVTGLTNDVTYYFVVSATNENGAGADSNEVQATPQSLDSPFTVEVRVLGSSAALEEWTAVDAYDGSVWSKAFSDVPAGGVTIEARLLESGTEVARDSIGVTVASAATRLSLTEAGSDVAGSFSDNATLRALLVTDEESSPIGGAPVSFELTSEDGTSRTWTAVSGEDGIAAQEIALDMAPGTYNLVAHFAGDDDHEASVDQMFFTVEREITETELVVEGKGKKRKLTATLSEDDGPRLGGREIVFVVDGTEIGRATTNGNGVATLEAPQGYRGDHFLFEANFGGTNNYRGSSGSYQT